MFSFRNGFYFQISCSGFNFVSDFSAWGGNLPGRCRGAWSRGRLWGLAPVAFHIVLHGSELRVLAPVGFHGCCPELRQGPALLRVLRKRNSSGKASSDAGPELAGRESCVAMESPQALMCPLEMGLAGLTSRHQTTGRVRVFATANTWRTQRTRGASGFGTESQ